MNIQIYKLEGRIIRHSRKYIIMPRPGFDDVLRGLKRVRLYLGALPLTAKVGKWRDRYIIYLPDGLETIWEGIHGREVVVTVEPLPDGGK